MTRFNSLRSLAFILSTGAAAASLTACSQQPPNIIVHADKDAVRTGQLVISGSATMEVSPDCADLLLTITGKGMRPGVAVDQLKERQQAVIAALKKLGVEGSDIKLSMMGIDPVYEWINDRNVLRGYSARIVLTATTKKFDLVGPMLEASADAGITEMSTRFRRSDLAELRKKVREQAMAAAREKAKTTASALGVDLGRVLAFNEGNQSYLFANEYFRASATAEAQTKDRADWVTGIAAELQPLTIEVSVTYELPETA